MTQNNTKIAVKNMVCDRCIKVIKDELLKNNIDFVKVHLGEIEFKSEVGVKDKEKLKKIFEKEGFELIENREYQLVTKIKALIIESIYHKKEKPLDQNFSEYISKNLQIEYSYLSKLFSEIEQKTIERYTIEQKIERVKELLTYNELTLSQISYELNYSSPQHLSRQFKKVTEQTPTQFKQQHTRSKLGIIY